MKSMSLVTNKSKMIKLFREIFREIFNPNDYTNIDYEDYWKIVFGNRTPDKIIFEFGPENNDLNELNEWVEQAENIALSDILSFPGMKLPKQLNEFHTCAVEALQRAVGRTSNK